MYKDHGLGVNKINEKTHAFNILRTSFATASSSALGQAGWPLCRERSGGAAGWAVLPSGAGETREREVENWDALFTVGNKAKRFKVLSYLRVLLVCLQQI